jgi:hypothetical protein
MVLVTNPFRNRKAAGTCLFLQVGQLFFHGLDLEPEFRQIGFQLGDLFRFGQEAALEVLVFAAAVTAAVTGAVLAITLFVHIYSPLDFSGIYASL